MQLISLKRNGKKPLVFYGKKVAETTDRDQPDAGCNVWILKLYRTSINRYILASEVHLFTPVTMVINGVTSFACAQDVADYLQHEAEGWEEHALNFLAAIVDTDRTFASDVAEQEIISAGTRISGAASATYTTA